MARAARKELLLLDDGEEMREQEVAEWSTQ